MPKLQSNFIEIALRHGCTPVNLLHIFRAFFPRNTYGWLLLPFANGPVQGKRKRKTGKRKSEQMG